MSLVEQAVKYAQLGWSVFPIRAIDDPHPDDPDNDKHPYIKWKSLQIRRADEKQIRTWWKKFPKARIGIVTGKISNLVVIDFDGPGATSLFESKICDLPDTIMQNTGRLDGGFHKFFKHPGDGYNIRPAVGKNHGMDGIDIRADGGYVVIAPSPHISGRQYEWGKINPIDDGLNDLLELPPEVFNYCKNPEQYIILKDNEPKLKATKSTYDPEQTKNKPGWVHDLLWGVKEGQRNHCAAKLAGYYLRFFSGDADQTWIAMSGWNIRNEPPLTDAELKKVLDSIVSREGINNFSAVVGKSLYNLDILKYPDGDVRYNLYVEGLDEHIQLTPDDLVMPRKFRTKFMVLTKTVIKAVKESIWFEVVEGVLKEAPTILMSEDETNISVVKRLIMADIKRGEEREYENPELHIDNVCILYRDNVHLYLNTLARMLQIQGTRFKSTKELGVILRLLGFKNKTNRINNTVLRTWSMPLDKFKKICFTYEMVPIDQDALPDTPPEQHGLQT
uniref:Putative bifunctional DNA primase/polymerase n=1 Tax=viral metagenome TaxID=1070528 RepID=A0A6M3IZJ0_9ZZZZ